MENNRAKNGVHKAGEYEDVCPRAQHEGKTPATFEISKDPAVQEVAKMIVAGVDKKYYLHPRYTYYIQHRGEEEAQRLIEFPVHAPGAMDLIQTDMVLGGIGLFGGLSKDGLRFVFYEWSGGGPEYGQLMVSITIDEARDIVEGRKKEITFYPVP